MVSRISAINSSLPEGTGFLYSQYMARRDERICSVEVLFFFAKHGKSSLFDIVSFGSTILSKSEVKGVRLYLHTYIYIYNVYIQ